MALTREKSLKALPVVREKVELPEFGSDEQGNPEYVWIHGMTAGERNRFDSSLMNSKWTGIDKKKAVSQKERMIIMCARDDAGNRIWSLTTEDIEAIESWPAAIRDRLEAACDRCNGKEMKSEDEADEAAKNLQETTED